MTERSAGTNGGECGTSGARRRRLVVLVLGFIAFAGLQLFVNASTSLADFANAGHPQTVLHVAIWELTSMTLWIALLPVIGWIVARARPPRLAWPWAIAAHAAATVPLSIAHVLGMIALRIAVYRAMGEEYGFGGIGERLLYEYRKDAATYVLLAAFFAFAIWWLSRAEPAKAPEEVVLVPDGNVTHHVPVDAIDWAASAGNYVEIAWGQRVLLHRSTLAALAETLGGRFVRIHRGRIVRRAAIQRIETDRSGDFTVTLAGGTVLRGSRRYRDGLG
ncbi:LytTR family DNA-binding domain-containing protein [Sphingomonas sp. dw_22]|uniref:LytR/AlgR family response regulator transcription factor n=1 Tax=Sphingomonas sp. dw_22 TaxID=2721175 RepID=UPI001BD3C290|nr:LytTR family DNA-binding domain-containing protein [Sphingomonas sp. dw_22]